MGRTVPRRTALRTAAVGVLAGAVAGAGSSCSSPPGRPGSGRSTGPLGSGSARRHVVTVRADAHAALLPPGTEPSVALARELLARATAVVVVAPDTVAAGTPVATALGIPLLVWGRGTPAELDRLGAGTVVRVPADRPSAAATPTPTAAATLPTRFGDREVVDARRAEVPEVEGLPLRAPAHRAVAVRRAGEPVPAACTATLAAVGATTVEVEAEDVRRAATGRTTIRAAAEAVVVGVTAGLGPPAHFGQRVRTVRRAAELPGGGFLPFPERRMVALYGHPRTASLGMLGEQPPARSVARAKALAAQYGRLSGERFVPAFELIATVASGSPGSDRSYSSRTPIRVLEPWVEAAADAGVYVVLDLQPGRTDFLTQARAYEPLLRRPHVGLALDPEWRLKPGQVHLEQIGSVGIDEVNAVGAWLAALVREHDLPPKVLTLHQFSLAMIRGRQRLDTGLDEVQWLVHADGQGSQSAKQATWAALKRDLPEGVWLGWKNFEDEDHPMLTPAQTLDRVRPAPSFVSYQ
ncbi:MAG TPA: hypothetical protein VFL46_05400 [Phycicoccus sp.]|nr:hypothetical protein [Phycicoccus sp.]